MSPVLLYAPFIREIGTEDVLSADARWLFQQDLDERLIAIPVPSGRPRHPVVLSVSGEEAEVLATPEAVYLSRGDVLSVHDPVTLAERAVLPPTPVLASVVAASGGKLVASGYHGEGLFVLAGDEWRQISEITGRPPLALSADGSLLVTCGGSYGPLEVLGLSTEDGRVLFEHEASTPSGHCQAVHRAPDGRFWVAGTEVLLAVDPSGAVTAEHAYPDGLRVDELGASARNLYGWNEKTQTVSIFSMVEGKFLDSALPSIGPVHASADDRRLVVEASDQRLLVLEPQTGKILNAQPADGGQRVWKFGCVWWVGDVAYTLDDDGILSEWDVRGARGSWRQLPFRQLFRCEGAGSTVAVDHNVSGTPLVWGRAGTFPLPELSGPIAVSADGTQLAAHGPGDTLWVGAVGQPLQSRPGPTLYHARFSPDAAHLGGLDLEGTTWLVHDLAGGTHRSHPVERVDQWAWTSRGVLLLGKDHQLRQLDPETGAVVVLGTAPDEVRYALEMVPLHGGGVVVLQGADYAVWTPEGGFRAGPPAKLGDDCISAPSPDGTQLLTACQGGTVWVRPLP